MRARQQLQSKLEELLGSRNVYYQPPESVKMEYPAIRYSKSNIKSTFADDTKYSKTKCYEIIVISKKQDELLLDKIHDLPYCSFDRSYKYENLYHDVFTLYY